MTELAHFVSMQIPLDTIVDVDLPALVQTLVEAIHERVEEEHGRVGKDHDAAIFAAWRLCEKEAIHLRDAAEELYEARGIEADSAYWWRNKASK